MLFFHSINYKSSGPAVAAELLTSTSVGVEDIRFKYYGFTSLYICFVEFY